MCTESWTLPCNQHTPWGQGPPLLMLYLPGSQWDSLCLTGHNAAPAIKESHNSSEGPDTLMSLWSSQAFVTDCIGPLGSRQSVGGGKGSLLSWVVMHGSNSVLLVAACRLWSWRLPRFTFLCSVRMLESNTHLQDTVRLKDWSVVLDRGLQSVVWNWQ